LSSAAGCTLSTVHAFPFLLEFKDIQGDGLLPGSRVDLVELTKEPRRLAREREAAHAATAQTSVPAAETGVSATQSPLSRWQPERGPPSLAKPPPGLAAPTRAKLTGALKRGLLRAQRRVTAARELVLQFHLRVAQAPIEHAAAVQRRLAEAVQEADYAQAWEVQLQSGSLAGVTRIPTGPKTSAATSGCTERSLRERNAIRLLLRLGDSCEATSAVNVAFYVLQRHGGAGQLSGRGQSKKDVNVLSVGLPPRFVDIMRAARPIADGDHTRPRADAEPKPDAASNWAPPRAPPAQLVDTGDEAAAQAKREGLQAWMLALEAAQQLHAVEAEEAAAALQPGGSLEVLEALDRRGDQARPRRAAGGRGEARRGDSHAAAVGRRRRLGR